MLVSINNFMGEQPARHPRLLAPNAAQLAVNTRLDDGAVTPLSGSTFVTDLVTSKKTIYLNGVSWLAWDDEVDALPGPTNASQVYVTGDGDPKFYDTAGATWYDLALPAPSTGPTTTILTGTVDPANSETILYAYTHVTAFGEESAPSPLSTALEWSEGCTVRVAGFEAIPAGRNIVARRIYRSVTSLSGTTDLYFVYEKATGTGGAYDHDITIDPTVEAIATLDYENPPTGLRGLISMPNGMMVAHTDRVIYFCEPYHPYAWPSKYSLTVDYDIVGLAAFGSQLAVLTKGTPYRGQGYHPESFSLEKIEENLPCLAKRGIVDLGYAAAYPSTEGLVLVSSSGAQVVSRNLFTRRDWAALDPSSFVSGQVNGRYVFGFSGTLDGGTEKTGIIDLTGQVPFLLRSDVVIQCAYHDIRTGRLHIQDADNILYIFDDTASAAWRDQTWRSKLHDYPFHIGFSCIMIEGDELDTPTGFEADVIADGSVIHTITTLNDAVRLPDGKAKHWEVEVRGKVSVTSIALATSMAELAGRG